MTHTKFIVKKLFDNIRKHYDTRNIFCFSRFPDKVKKEIHHAHCYMPANLAMVLDIKPSLLSAGVNAFYYRDPLDLKVSLHVYI